MMISFSLATLSLVCFAMGFAGIDVATDYDPKYTKKFRLAAGYFSLGLVSLGTVGMISWFQS